MAKIRSLAVVSGKGGAGKTSLAAAWARVASPVAVADCDVDAADLYLLLQPQVRDQGVFHAGHIAVVDYDKCTRCGECRNACAFGAIDETIYIDPVACEGCGVCEFVCPHGAASLVSADCGEWFVSETEAGPMAHARLYPGKENSGKLVSLVRKKAHEEAEKRDLELIIIDGPPGVGCPVIASVGGVDLVVTVAEPTVAGVHDAERVLKLAQHFRIPACVVINKSDINEDLARNMEDLAREQKAEVIGRIPYDVEFTKAQLASKTIVEYADKETAKRVKKIWKKLDQKLKEVK